MDNSIKNNLTKQIIDIIDDEYDLKIDQVIFEIPHDITNGHLSTNIALKNAKNIKKAPLEIGNKIKEKIQLNNYIKKIDVVNPGFINFYFSNEFFLNNLKNRVFDDFFGYEPKNKNINIEYVSANPTGELHLGHARNATFGDSLSNLLKRVGFNTIKEYYINDAGAQMINLGKSVKYFYLELCNQKQEVFPEDGYKGKEIKEIAQNLYDEYFDKKKDSDLDFFIQYGYEKNMQSIKNILNSLNVNFDIYSSEQYYHNNNLVNEAIEILKQKDEIYEQEGAIWLKTTKYGDDKDRVLQKSDGTHTYLTSDIAYHKDKMDRTNGLLINIWGGDHHGYIKRVEASMESLGYKKEQLEIVLIQIVSILENNEKVKMSKRAGTSVTINDLLNIIDSDALRYFFIMRSPDTQLDFDIALAQKQNSENPIFYIQYAHARINSLIEKANVIINKDMDVNEEKLTQLDIELIYKLLNYKTILNEAALSRRPHLVANYLYDVSTIYHKYYNQEKILENDTQYVNNKILISYLTKNIIKDSLEILGIKAKDKM